MDEPPVKKAKLNFHGQWDWRKFVKRDFLGNILKKFVGGGDPDVSNAQDVLTYLSEKYTPATWKSLLRGYTNICFQSQAKPTHQQSPLSRMCQSGQQRNCG